MLPTRTGLCVIAALLLSPAAARAQQVVEEPLVIDGQMTEVAALGQRLFDEGRLYEAAPVLRRVAGGDTGDAERDKQIAHYNLAVTLYRLKLYHASMVLFSEIADQPAHPMWSRALPWLSRLAVELPEPSGVIERVGKYDRQAIAQLNTREQGELFGHVAYLLGRHRYVNGRYEEAIRLFGDVGEGSKRYVEAQLYMGISYLQRRKPEPAFEAFRRAARAIDASAEPPQEKERLRSLASLMIARMYYSTSFRLGIKDGPKSPPPKGSPPRK